MNYTDYAVKILNTQETTGLTGNGTVERQLLVTFNVGGHGPYTQTFPKDGFDPMKAKAELAAFAQKIQQLVS